MGKHPTPPCTTIFDGLHAMEYLLTCWSCLQLFLRYMGDGYGNWLPPAELTTEQSDAKWLEFKDEVNNNHGLEWEFMDLSNPVNFLDMTTMITTDGCIKTTLYEKPMALYLFIPPYPAHPNIVLIGHIFGNTLRIFHLNSDANDKTKETVIFYQRFLTCGHKHDELTPLFLNTIENARKFIAMSNGQQNATKMQKLGGFKKALLTHKTPYKTPPHKIQQLFSETVLCPPGEEPLNELVNIFNLNIPIDAMIIVNHHAPNLEDMFSYQNISTRPGPPVFSFP